MKMDSLPVDFNEEQKRYLEGLAAGLKVTLTGRGQVGGATAAEPTGPDAIHLKAQDQVIASGRKLADQEKVKRELHPFDAYERLKQQARSNAAPSTADNFRWRYYGLFHVAPAQDSYM
ncbi:MAG: NirA family protein, partial [Bradyrhizobium sp.]